MYEEIFNQIRSAANKRNLKDSTIHAYCTSVAHFLNHTAKDIDALTTDDIVNIGLHFILKNVRPYAAPCSEA